jgi:hypothetical protein
MKLNFIFLFLTLSLHSILVDAQPPALIPYQAIARDAAGNAVLNQNISLRFSIHDQTITGTTVWQEAQTVLSNSLGVVVTNLGAVSDLSSVNWANGDKFLQVEMDITGGTNYSDMGTQQMMSVPYALYAGQAGQANQVGGSSLSLGDSHAGGVVVYLDQTGQHGFVMADSVFSAEGMRIYSGRTTSVSTGDGDLNTKLLAYVSDNNSVYYFIENLSHAGYNDWFVPSRDEIRRIYFDCFLPGLITIQDGRYITSTILDELELSYCQEQEHLFYAISEGFYSGQPFYTYSSPGSNERICAGNNPWAYSLELQDIKILTIRKF